MDAPTPSPRPRIAGWIMPAVGAALFALTLLPACSKPEVAAPVAAAPVIRPFPLNPDLRKAWDLIYGIRIDASGKRTEVDSTVADFAEAERLVHTLITGPVAEPEAYLVEAHIDVGYLRRGFDTSETRYKKAEKECETALELFPNNPEALVAMATYVVQKSPGAGGAVQLLHQAIAINPSEPRYYRILFMGALKGAQQMKAAEDAAAMFPDDYLTQVDLARVYDAFGLKPLSERALNRAIALAPNRDPAREVPASP